MSIIRLFRAKTLIAKALRNKQVSVNPLFDEDKLNSIDMILGFSSQEIIIDSYPQNNNYSKYSQNNQEDTQEASHSKEKELQDNFIRKMNHHNTQAHNKAREILEKQLNNTSGKTGLELAAVYDDLGVISRSERKFKHALGFFDKSLEIKKDILGDRHTQVLHTYCDIGTVYRDLGTHDKAIEYYQLALNTRLEIFKEDHTEILKAYNNIVETLQAKGDYQQALETSQKCLMQLKLHNIKSPEKVTFFENLGMIHCHLKQYNESLRFLNEAFQVRSRLDQANNPEAAKTLHHIGLVMKGLGRFEEALESFNKSLKIYKKYVGQTNQQIASLYNEIGMIYYNQGENEKAVNAYRKSIENQVEEFPQEKQFLAKTYNNFGLTLVAQGKYNKALESYKISLNLLSKLYGVQEDRASIYLNIGILFTKQKKYSEAFESFSQSLKLELNAKSENVFNLARLYDYLGKTSKDLQMFEKASEFYQKALECKVKMFGEFYPTVRASYNDISMLYLPQQSWTLASGVEQKPEQPVYFETIKENAKASEE